MMNLSHLVFKLLQWVHFFSQTPNLRAEPSLEMPQNEQVFTLDKIQSLYDNPGIFGEGRLSFSSDR